MPSITQANGFITFTNNYATFKITEGGRSQNFVFNQTGEELLAGGAFFAHYATKAAPNNVESPTTIDYNGSDTEGTLEVVFTKKEGEVTSKVIMEIACKAEPEYFLFELVNIDTSAAVNTGLDDIASAIMCQMFPYGDDYGGLIGATHKNGFVQSLMALNKFTHINSLEQSLPGLYAVWAQSFSGIQLLGMKAALLGCPKSEWLSSMDTIVCQFNLPRPTIDGVSSKHHPDVKTSYLFVDLTKDNADEIIQYAKLGRFKYIMPYVWTWAKSYGSYEVNTDHFPAGLNDLKLVAEKVHSEGLKLGLHCQSFLVGINSPLLASPHPGLAKESPVLLETSIAAGNAGDIIPIISISANSDAGHIDAYSTQYFPAREKNILIDNEIFTCNAFVKAEPDSGLSHRFENCTRGQYGTTPGTHDLGATVWHLPEVFGTFLAGLNSDLQDTIAENLAAVFHEVDGDLVFLDCSECARRLIPQPKNTYWYEGGGGGGQYSGALTAEKYLQKFQKGVLLQGSSLGLNSNFSWHLYSRGTGGDYGTIGVEGIMDYQRIGHFRDRVFAHSFFPMELGWIALVAKVEPKPGNSPPAAYAAYPATTLDEIEYQMNRALGFNLPISLETNFDELRANGSTKEILNLIGTFEQLRLSGYFPASMLEKLQSPKHVFIRKKGAAKAQYCLVRKWLFGSYGLKRKVYLEQVLSPGESWEFENPFHKQRLQVKITALPALTGEKEELPSDLASSSFHRVPGPDVSFLESADGIHVKYAPLNSNAPPYGYCWLSTTFGQALNLSKHKVLEVEITGDDKGEVLAIHLFDNAGNQRQFQFELDFTGKKTLRFPLPGGNSFFDHEPHYGGVLVLRNFDWTTITGMTIYVKKIPLGAEGVVFKLHGIRALKQEFSPISHPAFTIGNKTLSLSGTLNPRNDALNAEPWDYFDFDGKRYRKFDGNNNRKFSGMPLPWKVPFVSAGKNTLIYSHNGENLALVRLLLEDKPEFSSP